MQKKILKWEQREIIIEYTNQNDTYNNNKKEKNRTF